MSGWLSKTYKHGAPWETKDVLDGVPKLILVVLPDIDTLVDRKGVVDDDGDALQLRLLHETQMSGRFDKIAESTSQKHGSIIESQYERESERGGHALCIIGLVAESWFAAAASFTVLERGRDTRGQFPPWRLKCVFGDALVVVLAYIRWCDWDDAACGDGART